MKDDLHFAVQDGDVSEVRRLLEAGADPNLFDDLGRTPLHYAALAERIDLVNLLLESGADPNAHDERTIGNTPLGQVAGSCSLELAESLIAAGGDPTIPGWMGLSALDRASQRRRPEGVAVYETLVRAARTQ